MNAVDADRYCVTVTRRRAGNFYYGIRLLPDEQRRALCAVYAFARRIDDIGDGPLPSRQKELLLAGERAGLEDISPDVGDPVLVALARACRRFPIPVEAFGELIDGVQMDVAGTTYRRFEDLEAYCRLVAGSIGRLSVGVFGASDLPRAMGLADDLGVAMQLTNIVRDLKEDGARGRVYLPLEDLERFGCSAEDGGSLRAAPETLSALVRFECRRARGWFDRGLQILPILEGRSASCVRAMTGIYHRILLKVERHPEAVLRTRVSLPAWEKAWVAARSLAVVGS